MRSKPSTVLCSLLQVEEDDEHKEQFDKLLKFDQEFELPSWNTDPVTERTASRRVTVDHSYTERELSESIFFYIIIIIIRYDDLTSSSVSPSLPKMP